ncbi:hypothetical protein B1A_07046, partial [mine drainage metagenome]
ERNTLRYGVYADFQRGLQDNTALVFPADADGNQTSDVPLGITDNNRLLARTASAYVQDQWNISEQLTLNGGLRYDHIGGYLDESQSVRVWAWSMKSATTGRCMPVTRAISPRQPRNSSPRPTSRSSRAPPTH